jgi:glutathionylspermidine synthase
MNRRPLFTSPGSPPLPVASPATAASVAPPAAAASGAAPAAASVAAPAAALEALSSRSWGLAPDAYAELIRALRFRHFKWDTFAVGRCLVLDEALVLSRQAHDEVVAAVEALHRALQRFERRVRRDRDALRRMAIPDALHGIIADEEHDTLQLARYDLFPAEDGRWMVSEFNEDVPGGFNEAVIPELLGEPGDGLRWEGDLRTSFVAAFDEYETVALLYATAFSEDLQHMLILERWLAEAGHRTLLGSPAHLHARWRRPRVLGTPIDAAFRFYPGEWLPKLPNLDAWRRLGPRLPTMNPVHRLVRQSKTMFALWHEDPALSDDDRALLARHCPVTMAFDAAAAGTLRDERERWVLKRAFGRMGDSVVIGALCTPAVWDAALAEAVRAPREFCVQERFVARPVEFLAGPLYPAVGAFVVNGRFAGYYSRAAAQPLITHEAFHVATLVQSA